jgi:hypothetical protein
VNTLTTVHNQELQNTVHLIKFTDEVKQKIFWCAGHVAQMIKINAHRILVRVPKEKDRLEDLGIDGMVILKLFLEEQNNEV